MSVVVSLGDFTPSARYDGHPWTQARIEEAPLKTGPWAPIETVTLSPVDADPTLPLARNFTTEHADSALDWFRLVFLDATGDEEQPTEPVRVDDLLPSLTEVGALMRSHTRDDNGIELGTFTDDTRPTSAEASRLIQQAAAYVETRLGGIPDGMQNAVRDVTSLRAAMLIELSFFADQIAQGRSAYPSWKELYDQGIADLVTAKKIADEQAGVEDELAGTGMPVFDYGRGALPHAPGAETDWLVGLRQPFGLPWGWGA